MSLMQTEEVDRKRPATVLAEATKRVKVKHNTLSLSEMLSNRNSSLQTESENSDDAPHSRLVEQPNPIRSTKNKTKSKIQLEDKDDVTFELSTKRRVTVRKWKTMKFVDIREFYDDNGIAKPGKKGISLSLDQWEKLYSLSDAITEAMQLVDDDHIEMDSLAGVSERIIRPNGDDRAIALPLSNRRRITIRYFRNEVLVDLREFYEQDGEPKPGKKGISLSKYQWKTLKERAEAITEAAHRL